LDKKIYEIRLRKRIPEPGAALNLEELSQADIIFWTELEDPTTISYLEQSLDLDRHRVLPEFIRNTLAKRYESSRQRIFGDYFSIMLKYRKTSVILSQSPQIMSFAAMNNIKYSSKPLEEYINDYLRRV
jgi:hypothetical protein